MANAQTNFFPKLLGDDGSVIMTNAEFRAVVGRKIIFKQTNSGSLKSVDVEKINSSILSTLKIDVAQAVAKQKEIDAEKKRAAETYSRQAVIADKIASEKREAMSKYLAEKKKKDDEEAELRAEQARREREAYLAEQERLSVIEANRAEASRAKAAAGYLNRAP